MDTVGLKSTGDSKIVHWRTSFWEEPTKTEKTSELGATFFSSEINWNKLANFFDELSLHPGKEKEYTYPSTEPLDEVVSLIGEIVSFFSDLKTNISSAYYKSIVAAARPDKSGLPHDLIDSKGLFI